ncbi:MAG TPA: phosphoadenylyl-sulfate reductase [Trueperaceae bacterium]|nr:phosphoadenylyl-sulfate reductase [Trueperaceae bacterium]
MVNRRYDLDDRALTALNDRFDGAQPAALLRWAWEAFDGKVAASSSFQTQSAPLLHMISLAVPAMPVMFLDTGFHFPETLAYRDELTTRLGLNLKILTPRLGLDGFALSHGELHRHDPDLCCFLNKVEPLEDALAEFGAWVAGVRRDQTKNRASAMPVTRRRDGLVKLGPMVSWTDRDVALYLDEHDLPAHPLLDKGYLSVGCAPCTRPVAVGEDARAGRWAASAKTECGLHVAPTDS